MISLKQLVYALAVEDNLHFKKAADQCSVSQSALSTAITELEKQLGAQIFERDNKMVLVTAFGGQFLQRARAIKLQMDDLYNLAQAQHSPLSYPLSMGVIPTIGPYLLPKVLPSVRSRYPEFPLRIVEDQSHVLADQVRNGELDTAILALPYPLEGLLAFEFWQENFSWVTHASDAHAGQKEITSAELKEARLMLLKDGHCLKDHALAACRLQPSETDDSLSATSLYTLVQMVAGKMGSTLVPEMALKALLSDSTELKAVALSDSGPHRRIAFITRPNYIGVNNIELLRTLFRECLLTN